jgi:hypothetical protein
VQNQNILLVPLPLFALRGLAGLLPDIEHKTDSIEYGLKSLAL